ncbi:hypothetical protein Tco_0514908 [Tanacetum coccineum]
MEEPEKPTKRKDQIRHDEEVAQRLQAQLQAELEEEDRLVRQREEEANIVSWDNVQAMIDANYQMAQQMQAEEQEKLTEGSSKRAGEDLQQESIEKQKVDEDRETVELQINVAGVSVTTAGAKLMMLVQSYNCSKIKTAERVSTVREWIKTGEKIKIDWRSRFLT